MKILKRTKGIGEIFDTANLHFLVNSDAKPSTDKALHKNHNTTDHEFLSQFFPEGHPIFIQFSDSYFYDVTDESETLH